jgi:hypothetical protein
MDKNAFVFGEPDKLTLVSGDQAFTQAMVGTCMVGVVSWAGYGRVIVVWLMRFHLGIIEFCDPHTQVVHSHRDVPKEWSGDTSHARSFAVFYEQHVKKGKFSMNGLGRVSQVLKRALLLCWLGLRG